MKQIQWNYFLEEIMGVIGPGTSDEDGINKFMVQVNDNSVSGQAYEALSAIYHHASRARDFVTDSWGSLEGVDGQ